MPTSVSRVRRGSNPLITAIFIAIPCLVLAGAFWAPADSFIIVAPYVLGAVALLCVMLALLSRRLRAAALGMLVGCGVTGAVLAAPVVSSALWGSSDATGKPTLRLISFNMYLANPRAEEAINWVLDQKADFVILLEAAPAHNGEIERLRQVYPYSYGCAGAGYCSTLILSRRPAEEVWPLSRGDPENRGALSAVTARFAVGRQIVPLTAVHLDRPWPLGAQERFMGDLSDAVASVGRRGIVAGDFNSAPWTFAMRRLASAGELRLASGSAGTWPAAGLAGVLRLPLDQVYIGPCMARGAVRHGPSLGSDHLPVVTDVVIGDCRA